MHPREILPLTGLRGLAALMVLMAHALGMFPRDLDYVTFFTQAMAYAGITLFFVLSGFVITYNYAGRFSAGNWRGAAYRFFGARFARLYPLYLFVLLSMPQEMGVLLDKIWFLISYLFMTQSWFGHQSVVAELTWSVSTEWFFYVAFALAVPLLSWLMNLRACLIALIIVLFIAIGSQWVVFMHQQLFAMHLAKLFGVPESWTFRWLSYFSPYLRVLDFAMGVLAARLYLVVKANDTNKRIAQLLCRACAGLIILLLVLDTAGLFKQYLPFIDYMKQSHLYAPLIAIFLYSIAMQPDALGTWLSLKKARWVGERSYAIYLCQYYGPVIYNAVVWVPPIAAWTSWPGIWLRFFLVLLVLGGIVEILHRLVDIPGRRFLRRLLKI